MATGTVALTVAILAVALAGSVVAAEWPREPAAIAGIVPGEPFPSPADIADCPRFAPFRREPQSEDVCVDSEQGLADDRIVLRNLPFDGLVPTAVARLRDARVISLEAAVPAGRFAPLRALLVARYGPPQREASDDARGQHLTWAGRRLRLELVERAPDSGLLRVSAPAGD